MSYDIACFVVAQAPLDESLDEFEEWLFEALEEGDGQPIAASSDLVTWWAGVDRQSLKESASFEAEVATDSGEHLPAVALLFSWPDADAARKACLDAVAGQGVVGVYTTSDDEPAVFIGNAANPEPVRAF